jgi:drug/metabolite transporter (DMT)-like permease
MVPVDALHIAVGATLAIGASVCFEVGYVVQAAESRAEPVARGRRPLLARLARRRAWLGGTLLVVTGMVLQVAALALAPIAVVQPVLVLGLGLLVVLAERRLGEAVRGADRLAVAVAGAGALLVAVGGQPASAGAAAHPKIALGALGAVLVAAAIAGLGAGRTRALVVTAAAADGWAVLAAKLAGEAVADARPLRAAVWLAAAGGAAGIGLAGEMTALQRLPASTVGPLVLAAQVAIPVLLAPAVVGEHWGSWPLVVTGTLLATGAAVVLGRRREELGAGRR